MSSLVIFQITSLMCFLYALKIKMYLKNIVGFITISTIFVSILLSYFVEDFENIHYLLVSMLLIFIVGYNTYKSYRRSLA
jgi:hypothetical protein